MGVPPPAAGRGAFTLDAILLAASDTRFLAAATADASLLYAAGAVVALEDGWGLAGMAGAATVWLAARAGANGVRFAGERWASA